MKKIVKKIETKVKKPVEKQVEKQVEKPKKNVVFKKTAIASYVCPTCGSIARIESKEMIPQENMMCAQDLSLMRRSIVIQ